MDRLLTDEEIKNAVYDKPEQGAARWTKTVIPRDNKIAKAQDAKTAHIVAQEIIGELEERCPHTPDDAFDWIKRMCPDCFQTIKSKYMEEKDERTD